MKRGYLADTHVVLWSWHAPDRLAARHLDILRSDVAVLVSIAIIWEISIKAGAGKLKTVDDVARNVRRSGFEILPIAARHAEAVRHLPLHHRDPFDRLLIAQAQLEGLAVLTSDTAFAAYEIALA